MKQTLAALNDTFDASKDHRSRRFLPALKDLYIGANGQARIEIAPKGDPNDNDTMIAFAQAIETLAPTATGQPVAVQEAGKTVKNAFIEAGDRGARVRSSSSCGSC